MQPSVRQPMVLVRGDVAPEMVTYAHEKLVALAEGSAARILDVELRFQHHADPARARPNHFEATVDLDGTPVRAHRHAATMTEAIDRTFDRLRRRVAAVTERPQSRELRHRDAESWHHGDPATPRDDFPPRPVDARELVHRKTFALRPESIEEALFDLETLDHDFFLFVHDESATEAVVFRTEHGYGILQRTPTPAAIARVEIAMEVGAQPATMTRGAAIDVLHESGARFVFFVEPETGHAEVVYRRYDGNDGLITS